MRYFVVYTNVDVLNGTNDILCFNETATLGVGKRTLALIPKDMIFYVLAKED